MFCLVSYAGANALLFKTGRERPFPPQAAQCRLVSSDIGSCVPAGFYAGYVASAFTLGRFLTGYCWGCVSDAIGRKPVIVVGLSATALLSLSFGLSTSYTIAISSRWVVLRVDVGLLASNVLFL